MSSPWTYPVPTAMYDLLPPIIIINSFSLNPSSFVSFFLSFFLLSFLLSSSFSFFLTIIRAKHDDTKGQDVLMDIQLEAIGETPIRRIRNIRIIRNIRMWRENSKFESRHHWRRQPGIVRHGVHQCFIINHYYKK